MEEVHVPHDVVLNHMLPRVPTKSACRFKCVSKEWRLFLTSDMFKYKHNRLHVDDHENNNKLLVLSKTETSFECITIDCEAPPIDKVFTTTRRPLPPFEDTTPDDIHIIASCHGLVCLGIIKNKKDNQYCYLIIWNPLTNEYKRLSKSNSPIILCHSMNPKFGFYYSRCEDDYKLFYVDRFEDYVYIYSLKSDSWRGVDAFQGTDIDSRIFTYWSRGIFLNENLYFLRQYSDGRLSSIIKFDTKTERLSEIESPNVDDIPKKNSDDYFATMMVRSDCIHVCYKYDINVRSNSSSERTTCFKLWKLDEYENMKEVVTYQLRHDYGIGKLFPIYFKKNGSWLMRKYWWSPVGYQIYKVDLKEKKHIKDKSSKDGGKGNIDDDYELYGSLRAQDTIDLRLAINQVGYTETFVSPNQHMK